MTNRISSLIGKAASQPGDRLTLSVVAQEGEYDLQGFTGDADIGEGRLSGDEVRRKAHAALDQLLDVMPGVA